MYFRFVFLLPVFFIFGREISFILETTNIKPRKDSPGGHLQQYILRNNDPTMNARLTYYDYCVSN